MWHFSYHHIIPHISSWADMRYDIKNAKSFSIHLSYIVCPNMSSAKKKKKKKKKKLGYGLILKFAKKKTKKTTTLSSR